jgi:hypothetical protein
MLEAKLIPSPTKGVLVSVASILITISTGEVAALLCQINEASATLCGLYHSPRPDVPQDMRLFSVFLEIQRIHGTLFRQSVPCARLGIVELFGVIECAEKDVCICAKDLEILSANAQLAWVRQFDKISMAPKSNNTYEPDLVHRNHLLGARRRCNQNRSPLWSTPC